MSLDSKMQSSPTTKDHLASVPETQHTQPQSQVTNEEQTLTPMELATEAGVGDVTVPQLLQHGTPMTKVSAKERKRAVFRLDPDIGQIIWESKKHRISTSTSFSSLLN
jgi:phosphatidylinositol phospholipase C delta